MTETRKMETVVTRLAPRNWGLTAPREFVCQFVGILLLRGMSSAMLCLADAWDAKLSPGGSVLLMSADRFALTESSIHRNIVMILT